MKKQAFIVAMLFLLVAGCGTTGQEDKQQEETMSNSLFHSMEEGQALNDIVEEVASEEIKGLCEVLEEKEVAYADLYNAMNRMGRKNVFCVDETTGVVYFINFNQDWFIYRVKDGEAKLAVSLPASNLYTYKGSVYFLIDFYDDYTGKPVVSVEEYETNDIKQGDIYRYTPATGTVEFVYRPGGHIEGASTTKAFLVKEDAIYFSYYVPVEENSNSKRVQYEYLPFDKTKAIVDSSEATESYWGEYCLGSTNGDNICLIHKDDFYNQKVLSEYPTWYCLVGDEFYYTERKGYENTKLFIKNLATETKEVIDLLEVIKEIFPNETEESLKEQTLIESFVATEGGDKIWISIKAGSLICYNRITKEFIWYGNGGTNGVGILYTDGVHLYGQATKDVKEEPLYQTGFVYTLSRIYTEQDEMDEEMRKKLEARQEMLNEKVYMVEPITK